MGLEIITQPQVFLAGLTAIGGINGAPPPFYTSFYTWTTSTPGSTSFFQLNNPNIALLDIPSSYIISVGGVVQSPTQYSIDVINRTVNFITPVIDDTIITVTQIGTVGVSTLDISQLSANSSFFNNIVAINSRLTNVTATNIQVLSSQFFGTTIFDTVTATNLTVLSSTISVQNTVITPVSVISLTAVNDALFLGPISATDTAVFDQDVYVAGTIYTLSGDSDSWNQNITLVQLNSGNWNTAYDASTHVQTNSGDWTSSNILPTVTNYLSTSFVTISTLDVLNQIQFAGIDIFTYFASIGNFDQTLTFVQSSLELEILNGNVVSLSGINTTFSENSSKYEEVYTTVQSNSSFWGGSVNTNINTLTGNWQSTYETVCALSANWEETYTNVQSNSGDWNNISLISSVSTSILPTVIDYLSTSNVEISGLTVNDITIVSSNVFSTTTINNVVSALAINVNGSTLYLPLLSAV